MRAVILAGGQGTRLWPFTAVFPKPLMPLGDVPIMEVVLRQLARSGFPEVTVITGYLTELIEAFFGDGRRFGLRLSYRREVTPLGTAGGLALLDRPEEAVLVMNGDILTTLDYAAMLAFHHQTGARATVAAYPREVKIDFGVLEFGDGSHVLAGYREKPEFSFQVSMGVYILDAVAWDFLQPGQPLAMPDLLEALRGAGYPIHGFRQPCYWLDIGRHDDYATAIEVFQARREEFLSGAPAPRPHLRPDEAHESDRPGHLGHPHRVSDRRGPVRLPDHLRGEGD
jgi:NDP-sugar pyrophosphorylase family protein